MCLVEVFKHYELFNILSHYSQLLKQFTSLAYLAHFHWLCLCWANALFQDYLWLCPKPAEVTLHTDLLDQ